jgi:hypothetical protein
VVRVTRPVYGYSMRQMVTNLKSHCTETLPAGTYMSHVTVLTNHSYEIECDSL